LLDHVLSYIVYNPFNLYFDDNKFIYIVCICANMFLQFLMEKQDINTIQGKTISYGETSH